MRIAVRFLLVVFLVLSAVYAASAVTVAAYDSSDNVKNTANFVCDGTNDHLEIVQALNSLPANGGTVVLTEGTFNCAGDISLDDYQVLAGQGEDSTVLRFLTPNSLKMTIGSYVTVSDLQITGSGRVLISTSHNVLKNVKAYDLDNSRLAAFQIWPYYEVIEDIQFLGCKAIDCDRGGFHHGGEGSPNLVKNIYYENCQAIRCGYYDQYYGEQGQYSESWTTGFNFAETCDAQDVTYVNCYAEKCWESGWHAEPPPELSNIRLINCVSVDNAQKMKQGAPSPDFSAGFIITEGMYLENCISEDNYRGFYLNAEPVSELVGCIDRNSNYGYAIIANSAGSILSSCKTENSIIPVFVMAGNANIKIDSMSVYASSPKSGGGIVIDSDVNNPDDMLIQNSYIEGYSIGVNNKAKSDGLVDVINVEVVGADIDYVGCNVIDGPEPTPKPTPVPTPEPTPVPTPEPTPVPTPDDETDSVLFVVGSSTLNAGDNEIKARLESMGYSVTIRDDDDVMAADANSMDLILISSSIASDKVNTVFSGSAVPLITWEAWLFDDLGMTSSGYYGAISGQSQISITSANHALAGDLSGMVTVYSTGTSMMYGVVEGDGVSIATIAGDADKSVIFGYESGSRMAGINAPARRVGLYIYDEAIADMTISGWELFDAAIQWASSTPEPLPVIERDKVLFIVGKEKLNSGDNQVKVHLESMGYEVVLQDDDDVSASDAEGKTLVIASSSITSSKVGKVFKDVPVPFITWEAWLYPYLQMTGTKRGSDYGAFYGEQQILITNQDHELSAGMIGVVQVLDSPGFMMFGVPRGDYVNIAKYYGYQYEYAVFGYETGAEMAGMTAPAPRVGLFMHDKNISSMNESGWNLFDAAVNWAAA